MLALICEGVERQKNLDGLSPLASYLLPLNRQMMSMLCRVGSIFCPTQNTCIISQPSRHRLVKTASTFFFHVS